MVDLAAAKAHCRVDGSDDDGVLTSFIAAASEHLAAIGVDTTTAPVPAPVEQAMLLLIGHWFENREAVNVGNIITSFPLGVDRLVAPYREVEL